MIESPIDELYNAEEGEWQAMPSTFPSSDWQTPTLATPVSHSTAPIALGSSRTVNLARDANATTSSRVVTDTNATTSSRVVTNTQPQAAVSTGSNTIPLGNMPTKRVESAQAVSTTQVEDNSMTAAATLILQQIGALIKATVPHMERANDMLAANANVNAAHANNSISRKNTQFKDFQRGKLQLLEATILKDPEAWFFELESLLVLQNVHPSDYTSVLFNVCESTFKEDLLARMADISLDDYESIRTYITNTYGPRYPLIQYEKEMHAIPSRRLNVSRLIAAIQQCKKKHERARKRQVIARQREFTKMDEDLCFVTLVDAISKFAPNVVTQLLRLYEVEKKNFAQLCEFLHGETTRNPELQNSNSDVLNLGCTAVQSRTNSRLPMSSNPIQASGVNRVPVMGISKPGRKGIKRRNYTDNRGQNNFNGNYNGIRNQNNFNRRFESQSRNFSMGNRGGRSFSNKGFGQKGRIFMREENPKCFLCGRPGHFIMNCPQNKPANKNPRFKSIKGVKLQQRGVMNPVVMNRQTNAVLPELYIRIPNKVSPANDERQLNMQMPVSQEGQSSSSMDTASYLPVTLCNRKD